MRCRDAGLRAVCKAPCTTLRGSVPPYTEAPVFYEFSGGYYGDRNNAKTVHDGKLNVGVMGEIPIDDFSWSEGSGDPSYWVAVKNFRYLIPIIASDRQRDRDFVREWIRGWLDAHERRTPPNPGAVDAMWVGTRAMAFTWYLGRLHERGEQDQEWVARIKSRLLVERLAPSDTLSTIYRWRLTTRSRRKFEMTIAIASDIPQPHQVQMLRGQSEPYFAWYSPSQHVQLPVTVIRIDLDVIGWARVHTSVKPDGF